jgi:hypothetical protein
MKQESGGLITRSTLESVKTTNFIFIVTFGGPSSYLISRTNIKNRLIKNHINRLLQPFTTVTLQIVHRDYTSVMSSNK